MKGTKGMYLFEHGKAILITGGLALISLFLVSCGSDSPTPSPQPNPNPGSGSALLSVQDAPLDNLVKFEITVSNVILNPGTVVLLPGPQRLELTSLQLTPEVLKLAPSVSAGTYTTLSLTLSDPEIQMRDPNTGDIVEIKPPLQTSALTLNVSLTVLKDQAQGLLVDFDLAASLLTDAGGNITGIDPSLAVSLVNLSAEQNEVEDMTGRVVSVSSTGADTGTFVLESFITCSQLTFSVNANTQFEDFTEADPPLTNVFASLAAGQIVEVDADATTDGALTATKVELEDEAMEDELEGLIVTVTRNAIDQVSQFQMVLFEVAPCTATLPAADLMTVDVPTDGSVRFRIQDEKLVPNVALFDDPTDLEVGQKVDVDPVEPVATDSTTFTAEKIKLNRQTLRGTVALVGTMTFELVPTADLFPDQSITVLVSSETRLDGLNNDFNNLRADDSVRVKGLLLRNAGGELELVALRLRKEN